MKLPHVACEVGAKCEHGLTDRALVAVSWRILRRSRCNFRRRFYLWLSSCWACRNIRLFIVLTRLVVLESGLGLESIFAGLGLETPGLELGIFLW